MRKTGRVSKAPLCCEAERKADRATTRRKRFADEVNVDIVGHSFLERRTVRADTEKDYRARYDKFVKWAEKSRLEIDPVSVLDGTLLLWAHENFFEGETADEGSKLVAAIMYCKYKSSKNVKLLPRIRAALAGWRRLAPARSRLPLPWPVAAMIVDYLIPKLRSMAVATALAFAAYLRPSELLRLRRCDVVPPLLGGAGHAAKWSLVLHPLELEISSKTGDFNESIVMDNPEFRFLDGELHALWGQGHSVQPAFDFSYAEWANEFHKAGLVLGLNDLGPPVLYQLQHGGASHEVLTGRRSTLDVQNRGRWRTVTSVKRYEKGGRINQVLALVPVGMQQRAHLCTSRISQALGNGDGNQL